MIELVNADELSSTNSKIVIEKLVFEGGTADTWVDTLSLRQKNDTTALEAIVDHILSENASQVEEYKNGKTNLFGFFVGQCMKASQGQGNPNTWTGPVGTTFNGNASPYTTTSTSVTAVLPVGYTSGSICVTANASCVSSAPKCLAVSTSPSAIGVMSGVFSVCPNTSQTYSVPNAGAGTYNWTLPANASGSSTSNSITVTVNSGFLNGNISVTYTNVCGVTSAARTKTIAIGSPGVPSSITGISNGVCGQTISYQCPPQAGATFTWSASSLSAGVISGTSYLCVNDSTTLSSTISTGTWSSSNNTIATVDNNGFVHAIKSGNVTITHTVTGNSPCGTTAQSNYYITIFNLPKPNPLAGKLCIDPTTGLAVNAITLHSYLDATQHSFTWMHQLGNVVGTSANLPVTIPGDYTILAQNTITGCISDPVTVNVGAIEQPDVIFEVSDYFEDNQSITIIPKGNINPNEFIYSIDNSPFQSSNVFENVATGTHTITIKNPEGCVDKTITAFVINYPKYFTPNGDGVHDTWYIKNMNLLGNSKITIFDRYNAVVRIINNPYQSWDGTANGVLLPASDYWFVIEYTENNQPKVFKSHFSLKR